MRYFNLVVMCGFALGLVLSVSPIPAQAAPSTPSLISYQQLIRLRPAERRAYMKTISQMLVKLEELQEKQSLRADASDVTELKEKLIAMLSWLPEAHAAANEQPPAEDKPVAAAEAELAPSPFQCDQYSQADRDKARKDMVALNKANKVKVKDCIFGGQFSSYRGGRVAKGNCESKTSFTWNNKPYPCGHSEPGKKPRGLCNPYIFCVENVDSKSPPFFCRPIENPSQKGVFDLTKRCAEAYERLAKGDQPLRPCQSADDGPYGGAGAKEEWSRMRDQFNDKFKSLCQGGDDAKVAGKFKILFCQECDVMWRYSKLARAVAKIPDSETGESSPGETPADEAPAGEGAGTTK